MRAGLACLQPRCRISLPVALVHVSVDERCHKWRGHEGSLVQKYILSDSISTTQKGSPCEDSLTPETCLTFLRIPLCPECTLRVTVFEHSDRFALVAIQKVKCS